MGNKKLIMFLIIFILIVIVFIIGFNLFRDNYKNDFEISNYTPEAEITDEQLRNTIITLYFRNKSSLELVPEARKIDAKILLNNPYETLVQLLIDGPRDDANECLIPKNSKINSIKIIKNIAFIDFSEQLVTEDLTELELQQVISSIEKTLLQLTEISGIRILINGKEF